MSPELSSDQTALNTLQGEAPTLFLWWEWPVGGASGCRRERGLPAALTVPFLVWHPLGTPNSTPGWAPNLAFLGDTKQHTWHLLGTSNPTRGCAHLWPRLPGVPAAATALGQGKLHQHRGPLAAVGERWLLCGVHPHTHPNQWRWSSSAGNLGRAGAREMLPCPRH